MIAYGANRELAPRIEFHAAHNGSRGGGAVTVCGNVAAAREARQLRGEPVLLTLGHAYAGQDLTVVILGDTRAQFGVPDALVAQTVCVSGPVRSFFGKPRMVLGSAAE